MSKDFPVIIQMFDPVDEVRRRMEEFQRQKGIDCKWVKNNYADGLPEGFMTWSEYHEAIRASEREMMIEVLEEQKLIRGIPKCCWSCANKSSYEYFLPNGEVSDSFCCGLNLIPPTKKLTCKKWEKA